MGDRDITSEYQDNFRYAQSYWEPFVKDAQVYTLAASGYTWSDAERKALALEGREPIELNIMRRPLQFFSGYLRDNINSVVYGDVDGGDKKTADQLTKIGYQIWDKGSGYATFLDGCDESFKSGIALCGIRMDYSKDFVNGDIVFYNRTYNSFYLDPTFERIDLVDCSFAITRDVINADYAKQLLPDVDPDEIDCIHSTFADDKFLSYRPDFKSFSRKRGLLTYDQYFKRVTRERKFLVDLDSGFYRDITDLPSDDRKRLKEGIGRFKSDREISGDQDIPNVEIRTVSRPYVELHVALNGQHVFSGEDNTGVVETYPFVPLICYMEPSIWMPSQRIQGMSSCQWSNQRQFNKRHMKIIDMMDSVISTGYKYLIGSVPDPQDMQQSGQNRLIGVDPAAPAGLASVEQLQGLPVNQSIMEYQSILDKLSLTLGNVTEASLGMDEQRNTLVSGRLAQVQIAQNLMSNRKVFDNIDTAQRLLGGIILPAIQVHYPPGKVKRILNEEPTQEFYDQQFGQYDAVIKEGVRSRSQRDAYYYELVNLKRDGIVDVPEEAIMRALDMVGMSDLQEDIAKQGEQKAQQQAKIDEQERMALELANSQKIANLSLSKEREARILADIGLAQERASEASSNIADAVLARAKAITEIASMEEDRVIKLYEFINSMQKQEQADRQVIQEEGKQLSAMIDASTEIRSQEAQRQQQPEASVDTQQIGDALPALGGGM
ncbi:MAG: hypothetical protein Q8O94_03470 [bacterium]|nr:hypothetical protein [bacterium]